MELYFVYVEKKCMAKSLRIFSILITVGPDLNGAGVGPLDIGWPARVRVCLD